MKLELCVNDFDAPHFWMKNTRGFGEEVGRWAEEKDFIQVELQD